MHNTVKKNLLSCMRSLYLARKCCNDMYGSLGGKVNSSSAGQDGQLDCGEDWVFVSAGQLSLSQKVLPRSNKMAAANTKGCSVLYCAAVRVT